MIKTTAALLVAAIAGIVHAEIPVVEVIPLNCVSKTTYGVDPEIGSWKQYWNRTYEKTDLGDNNTQYRDYREGKYGNFSDTKTIYNGLGRLVHKAYQSDSYRVNRRQNFENTAYFEDGSINYINGMQYRNFTGGFINLDYSIYHEYLLDGKLHKTISCTKHHHYRYTEPTFDTATTTYSYDNEGRVNEKVTTRTSSMEKKSSRFTYDELPTGETLIVENRSMIDWLGNWKRPKINPVKKYCLPNDTITEEYIAETGELARRINASYTYDGRIADSTVYGYVHGDSTFVKRTKTMFQYENPAAE